MIGLIKRMTHMVHQFDELPIIVFTLKNVLLVYTSEHNMV